jgi:mono/diheme cytochrome c family protein
MAKPAPADLGARTYSINCAACHQESGAGVPAAFPPLAGHVPALLAQPGGRGYVIRVLIFGLEGSINVTGANFAGAMPAWGQLDDNAIAAVLNHVVTTWDNKQKLAADFKRFEAGEIAAARAERMTAATVYALRQKIFSQTQQAGAKAPAAIPVSFTERQAAQGKAAYEHNCMDCHGTTMDNGEFGGAPLRGAYFKNKWGNGSVANLYAYTKTKMPPDRPGALSDKVYADLVAHILTANGYEPGGRELPTDPSAQQSMSLKRE